MISVETLAKRYWPKVEVRGDDECWPWHASMAHGYGRMFVDGKTIGAHVVGYLLAYGPVPEGLEVAHSCETSWCQNPKHFIAMTPTENKEMRWSPLCGRGHTKKMRGDGTWVCYQCKKERRYAIRAGG